MQTKVREATSNDPWGPSGTQMNEIAQLTYNQWVSQICADLTSRGDFVEIMEMLDKRLNDKGKNWRHVFKVRRVPKRFLQLRQLRLSAASGGADTFDQSG